MDIGIFLEKFKAITDAMSEKELREWLYDYAQKLPESKRHSFLASFSEPDDAFNSDEIDQAMFWASDWLDAVEDRKKRIYYIQDEALNDWYYFYEQGSEFEGIEDRDGILKEFARVLEIIERMVEASQFEDAAELLERLFQIELITPIIWKYDDSEIDEMFVDADELFEAAGFNAEHYGRLWVYAIVQLGSKPNFKRLFETMKARKMTDINVIQTVGPHEIKADGFIDEWMAFVAGTPGHEAYVLLREACRTHKSIDFIEENLAEFGQMHPLLFLDVLSVKLSLEYADAEFDALDLKERIQKLSKAEMEDIANIVQLAEAVISKELRIGAEVMEVGFELAKRMDNGTKAAHYRKQAFRYHSSIVNYSRLRPYLSADELVFYKDNWAKYAQSGFRSFSALHNVDGLARNTLSDDQIKAQLFFTERFEAFYKMCKEKEVSLGWSSNLLGFGVPLFLLLLNKNYEQTAVMKWMEGYVVGRLVDSKRDRHYFSEAFSQFKQAVTVPKELEEELVEWLGEQISARTEALLGKQRRNAYYRAAELIVAYGEVLESRGEKGARARTAEQYRQKYKYFRRFTKELKERL